MERGSFTINGISSNELNSLIQYRPEIPTPQRKVDMRSVPGVSGDYIFDEEAYENTSFSLELFTFGRDENEINDLKELITYTFDSGGYIDFTPYWDEDMVYQVKTIGGPIYTPDGQMPLLLNYTIELAVKPFKHYAYSVNSVGNDSLTVNNPSFYEAEPIITLYGTGDMNLVVNDETFAFQDIDTDVIVDSQIESAYRLISGRPESRNNRMYTMDFPILKPGANFVEVTGSATNFEIEPRWRKLVS